MTKADQKCKYSCAEQFELNGQETHRCVNKDFSSSWLPFQDYDDFQIEPKKLDHFLPPKCIPICGNHETVTNGHVTCTGGNVTDTCSITCDNGYNLIKGTALF